MLYWCLAISQNSPLGIFFFRWLFSLSVLTCQFVHFFQFHYHIRHCTYSPCRNRCNISGCVVFPGWPDTESHSILRISISPLFMISKNACSGEIFDCVEKNETCILFLVTFKVLQPLTADRYISRTSLLRNNPPDFTPTRNKEARRPHSSSPVFHTPPQWSCYAKHWSVGAVWIPHWSDSKRLPYHLQTW